MNYLILNKERSEGVAVWWRPGRHGYTSDVQQAGRYSKEEAESIAGIRGEDWPVPENEIGNALKVRHIVSVEDDDNYAVLKSFERGASPTGDKHGQ